jgi:hypothetical protein
VRVGGGFMKFEEWIQRFGRKEGLMIAGGIFAPFYFSFPLSFISFLFLFISSNA